MGNDKARRSSDVVCERLTLHAKADLVCTA